MLGKTNIKRPPIVVVIGHVDHGKTTLLDYIKKTNVAAKEAGGITQSVGAYEIIHRSANSGVDERITFIDTPGHEAFARMRGRGAKIADIAILVVAADDGVKAQTKEVIALINSTKIRYIVAITKMDASGADVDRVKNDLTANGVLLEGYGGSVSYQAVSGKTGVGVSELLDLILLTAEVEGLVCDPSAPATGFILEAKMESRRGIVVTAIVTNGDLAVGDELTAGGAFCKIRSLENFLGVRVKNAVPSSPVVILGFETLPIVGEVFNEGKIEAALPVRKKNIPVSPLKKDASTTTYLLLKADTAGSLEALRDIIAALVPPKDFRVSIVEASVGEITDGDVKMAQSTGSMIIGFNVRITKAAELLARAQAVRIVQADIIYKLAEAVAKEFLRQRGAISIGELEILGVFGVQPNGGAQIVGGKVVAGSLAKGVRVDIERRGVFLAEGTLTNIQKDRKDVAILQVGEEGGLLVVADAVIKIGDRLIQRDR